MHLQSHHYRQVRPGMALLGRHPLSLAFIPQNVAVPPFCDFSLLK